MHKVLKGFSRLSKQEKIDLISTQYSSEPQTTKHLLSGYWNTNAELQTLHDGFSENTLSNYYMPYGIAPNFVINGHTYAIPMVVEESSVVAALSKSASFWSARGGFKAQVRSMIKKGQVHFVFDGDKARLSEFFDSIKDKLLSATDSITKNMRSRRGGILDIKLLDKSDIEPYFYQIDVDFDTCDSMGANFINSCLETIAGEFESLFESSPISQGANLQIVMSILSNYTPECVVKVSLSSPVETMSQGEMSGEEFCGKFVRAVKIASCDTSRAVTHNKGIMNGVDAVVIATGNDFRATEASCHSYAGRSGVYRSLSQARVEDGIFIFDMELPLALGTVGGLTSLHPLSKLSMELLGHPSAAQLMMIVASVGLAQNYAAVSSLVTTGIQKGHMKMHLGNILSSLGASEEQREAARNYFSDKTVSFSAVNDFLKNNISGDF